MKVLFSLLGLSPGVVTGAYYALHREGITVDKVVTLGTNDPRVLSCEEEIAEEFRRCRQETPVPVQYDETCRFRIDSPDLRGSDSVEQFQTKIRELLQKTYQQDEVYLVVAGGRKSMAAVAAIAAQLYGYGVQRLDHLYVDEDLEEDGAIDGRYWEVSVERRHQVLHPEPEQVELVNIPYIHVNQRAGNIELVLKGDVEEYIYEFFAQNPAFRKALDKEGKVKYWSYLFEVKVAQYVEVHRKYRDAKHHYKLPGVPGDVDVYARSSHENFEKLLVCECKLRVSDNPDSRRPLEEDAVGQLARKLPKLRETMTRELQREGKEDKPLELEAWVVSNTRKATAGAWDRAHEYGIHLMTTEPPGNWKDSIEWSISRIDPMPRPG